MSELQHETYMRRAIEPAGNVPELPFGAVIVEQESGEILAEGWNRTAINPTWHGEMVAINQLVRLRRTAFEGSKLALYSTAEPCPMCQGTIHWCGLGMVVYGTSIDFLRERCFKQILIPAHEVVRRAPHWHCTVLGGILQQECDALFLKAA